MIKELGPNVFIGIHYPKIEYFKNWFSTCHTYGSPTNLYSRPSQKSNPTLETSIKIEAGSGGFDLLLYRIHVIGNGMMF